MIDSNLHRIPWVTMSIFHFGLIRFLICDEDFITA